VVRSVSVLSRIPVLTTPVAGTGNRGALALLAERKRRVIKVKEIKVLQLDPVRTARSVVVLARYLLFPTDVIRSASSCMNEVYGNPE
jgi:hypothetical protein